MPETDLTRESARLRLFATLVFAGTALIAAGPLVAVMLRATVGADVSMQEVNFGLLATLPSLFFLWGVWCVRRVAGALAKGALFEPVVVTAVRDVGVALVAGAAAGAIVVPNLGRWGRMAGLLPGHAHPFESLFYFDTAYVAVGMVGLALMLLARLVKRAADERQRADTLKAELDEFF